MGENVVDTVGVGKKVFPKNTGKMKKLWTVLKRLKILSNHHLRLLFNIHLQILLNFHRLQRNGVFIHWLDVEDTHHNVIFLEFEEGVWSVGMNITILSVQVFCQEESSIETIVSKRVVNCFATRQECFLMEKEKNVSFRKLLCFFLTELVDVSFRKLCFS